MIDQILEAAYLSYLEYGGTGRFDLSDVKEKYDVEAVDLGRYLVAEKLVKQPQFSPSGFAATISMTGIARIHPEYIDNKRDKIMDALGTTGRQMNILKILGLKQKELQLGADLAKQFETEGLLHATYTGNVLVTLSEDGRLYYEENKPFF